MKMKNKLHKTILGFAVLAGAVFSYGDVLANEGLNLIANPSFETVGTNGDPTNWFRGGYGTNTRIFTYPVIGVDGNKAAKVEITNYTNGDAKWYFNDVPVIGGKTYTFTHSYKSLVTTKLGVRYQTEAGYEYQSLGTLPTTNGRWMTQTRNFTLPMNAKALTIFHVLADVGTLETDAFSLTPTTLPVQSDNLIINSSFEEVGINGDPVGWFRGGYGQNTRSHGVAPCTYYTEEEFVRWPDCPPNTSYKLGVHIGISDYISGDAKWYFADVPIGTNKNFRIAYQYQVYTYNAKSVARFAFPDGSYSYSLVSDMPQGPGGGSMGYSGWATTEHDFTAPAGATSVTVFFSVLGTGSGVGCCSGDEGNLAIANVSLKLRDGTELPPRDLTLPVASITTPIAGATVSGTTTVSVNASDNIAVAGVTLFVNGAMIGVEDTTAPYIFSLGTTALSNTSHILTVRTRDTSANFSVSVPITVTVANTAPTTQPSLIANSSFETLDVNGDPVGWFHGGYGNNTRTFSIVDYPPILPDSSCSVYVYQNPDGEKAGRVEITDYVNGDAKWYFSEVPIGNEKTFKLQHWYRSSVTTQLSARYLLNDGSYLYKKIVDLGHTRGEGCMGAYNIRKVDSVFTAPNNAVSMTLFHSLFSNGFLETDNFILTN